MTRRVIRFGYTINYDKEIASDDLEIAACDRALAHGYAKPEAIAARGYYYPLWRLAFEDAAVANSLELSKRDLYALADYAEIDERDYAAYGLTHETPEVPETRSAFLERGKAALAKCTAAWPYDDLLTMAELKRCRARAVAARSRHRRNKEKYGRTSP